MLFRQLFDAASSTYTYLLGDPASGEALLIDPVFEQTTRDLSLLQELGLTLKLVVDTHAHADHVTAAWLLKQKTGCQIASAAVINAEQLMVGCATLRGRQREGGGGRAGAQRAMRATSSTQMKAFPGEEVRQCTRCVRPA